MELTKSEMEIMDVLWESSQPLSRSDLLERSKEKTWKDSSVHILLNGLLLCYLAAAVTEPVRKALVDGKNRLLDWAAGKQFRKTTS